MELGRQAIATGAVVWRRVPRIPPLRHGALSLGNAPAEASVGRTYGGACTDFGVWKASNYYRRCSLEAVAPYSANLACGQYRYSRRGRAIAPRNICSFVIFF